MNRNEMTLRKASGRANKLYILAIIIMAFSTTIKAQTNINIGGGYHGHFLTHPGAVLEIESERVFSEKASLPIRLDVGLYSHPRNHTGLFMDLNFGYRKYLKSGFFFEESVGIGVLQSFLNSDDVYEVDESGNMSESSRAMPIDLLPSITLGLGYNLSKDGTNRNLIWMRPKIAWQIPHKISSLYHISLQIGFTHTINTK
ncbi:hypothetical protein ACFLT1_06270 [Bacteroidota bacterium]